MFIFFPFLQVMVVFLVSQIVTDLGLSKVKNKQQRKVFKIEFNAFLNSRLLTPNVLQFIPLYMSLHFFKIEWFTDIFGKNSAQPHTIVKQICFPNGNVLFLSLFSLSKNRMHNVVWGCAEILLFLSFAVQSFLETRGKTILSTILSDKLFYD